MSLKLFAAKRTLRNVLQLYDESGQRKQKSKFRFGIVR